MKILIEYISQGIAFMSIAIIIYGTILAVILFIKNLINKEPSGIRKIIILEIYYWDGATNWC